MKGLIIPTFVILATGFLVEIAYADLEQDATAAQHDRVVQLLKAQDS